MAIQPVKSSPEPRTERRNGRSIANQTSATKSKTFIYLYIKYNHPMPTPIPPAEKTSFINLVKVAPYPGGPLEADRLQTILINYEDVNTAIMRQLELFASNNSYLLQAISVFDQVAIQAVGIWVNQTSSTPLVNPVLIINSTYDTVTIALASPPVYNALTILGSSTITTLELNSGVTLNELYIGPGCTVKLLNGSNMVASPPSSPPTMTEVVYLPFAKSTPSRLNATSYDSVVNSIVKDEGSYYGGIQSKDPTLTCAEVVTDISATETTKNGVLISWTNPANIIFVNVFYRKTNSNVWLPVDDETGDWFGDNKFTFRHLESDTFYDVQIVTTCINGATASNQITLQTTCCGAGTQMGLYKNCPITMLIGTDPTPTSTQVLCNGVTIPLYYPPGPTITVSYLATVNCSILEPFVIDNANYQLMPYNPATGTWDASTTPVGSFVEGNTVTVNVSIPA